jgi:transposase
MSVAVGLENVLSVGDLNHPSMEGELMIVIGVDAHTQTHTAAAVVADTAVLVDTMVVPARLHGHMSLLTWARAVDPDRVWALEDCRRLTAHLERVLLQAGERVVRVPPKLMVISRKAERTYAKSDAIDAISIARAAVREPELPAARLPGIDQEIRLLLDHRDDLLANAPGINGVCAGICMKSILICNPRVPSWPLPSISTSSIASSLSVSRPRS